MEKVEKSAYLKQAEECYCNSTLCNLNEDEKIVLMELVENSNSTSCNLKFYLLC